MNRLNSLRWLLATAVVLVAGLAPANALATPPSNDNFANAQVLTNRVGWVDGETTDATKEPGEPNHAGNPGGASVWYAWTAPYAGRMTMHLCWSEYDTLLAVYTGDQLINLQEVAANDNSSCGEGSRVVFTTVAGTTYRIAVDGANGASGYFDLEWGLAPANDDFAASVQIAGDNGSVAGDNAYATSEPGEPEHGPYGGSSVWYRWTAPSSGPAAFELCASEFDTLLAVYTGSTVDGLTRVAQDNDDCPDNYGSRVSFSASAGQEYRIAVDGAYREYGDLTLGWSRSIFAPRIHSWPSVLGVAVDGAMLTATNGEWGGTPPFTFGYQWARCSFDGSGCQPISGATGATYILTSADVARRVEVLVTASNAAGSATAESDVTGIVSPAPPANVTVPRILGATHLGGELTVDEGSWSGTQPFTYTYRWERCGPGACFDIDGETSSTYVVSKDDLKRRLRVIVTATNGAGSATAASAPSSRAARRVTCVVPRVRGKSLAKARQAIRRAHCSVGRVRYARSRSARGRVISQSPKAGARKASGTKVNLLVSRGRR